MMGRGLVLSGRPAGSVLRVATALRGGDQAVSTLRRGRRALSLLGRPSYICSKAVHRRPTRFGPPDVASGRRRGQEENAMNFEKYTERARGFVQSAQTLALREGHQQFTPEHLLKVLLDDEEGLAAGLIDRAGGDSRDALAAGRAGARQAAEGRGRRRRPALSRPRHGAHLRHRRADRREGRRLLRHRRAAAAGAGDGEGERGGADSRRRRRHAADAQRGDRDVRKGRTADSRVGRERL